MSSLKSLLFGTLAVSVAAVNSACSNQPLYSIIAAQISGLPEAQSYCSKNYPIPTKTSTLTAATSTVMSTVATTTVTSTTATILSTTTATITTTVTVTQNAKRALYEARAASSLSTTSTTSTSKPPSTLTTSTTAKAVTAATTSTSTTSSKATTRSVPNIWASVLSAQSAIIGQICSCAENPRTSTVYTTPITTASITATATSNVATTSTVTTTSTVLATSTVVLCTNGNYCSSGRQFNIECGTFDSDGGRDIEVPASDWAQCARICAADSQCQSFAFNFNDDGTCSGYYHINRNPLGPIGQFPGYVYGTRTGAC